MLSLPSIVAAAQAAGVNDKTARRWLKLPHFQAAYKAAQKALFDEALSALLSGVDTAINTLKRNMTSEDVPPSTQVRAAQIWLEQAISLHKMSDLEQKIAELELFMKETRP